MKIGLSLGSAVALLTTVASLTLADQSSTRMNKPHLADNSAACMASCASQNASCKRVCPSNFNTPCLSACDSQYQTCTQGCQQR